MMISWIQKTFQHHFRAIFAVLLGITIVSFIFTIGSTPGIGGGEKYTRRTLFGKDLTSQLQQQQMASDAEFSVTLQAGFVGMDAEGLQNYAMQRMTALHLADEMHIPGPTTEEIANEIKMLRYFAGPDGQFDAAKYATFRSSVKTSAGGEGEINRILVEDWRANRVQQLLAGPGYVLPGDVKSQMVDADTTWTISVGTADYATFAPAVAPTEAELSKFFADNSFRYEIPPRVVAGYVEFPGSDYAAQVTVTDDEIKAFYDSNPGRFPKPNVPASISAQAISVDTSALSAGATPTPAAASAVTDFAAVKPQVEAALRQEKAKRAAARAASELVYQISESKPTVDSLPTLLAAKKVTLKPLAPFTKADGPAELGKSADISAAAFELNPNRPLSDALLSPNGAVVLAWKEVQTVRTPSYVEVKDRVSTDYVENEKRKRFIELGRTAKAALETRLKAGDDFEKASAEAASAGLKIEQKSIPAFSLRNPPADLPETVLNSLENLSKGQVSDMVVGSDKGYFVHVADKKLPDTTDANPAYASTRDQLAAAISRYNAQSYLGDILSQELKKSEPAAP